MILAVLTSISLGVCAFFAILQLLEGLDSPSLNCSFTGGALTVIFGTLYIRKYAGFRRITKFRFGNLRRFIFAIGLSGAAAGAAYILFDIGPRLERASTPGAIDSQRRHIDELEIRLHDWEPSRQENQRNIIASEKRELAVNLSAGTRLRTSRAIVITLAVAGLIAWVNAIRMVRKHTSSSPSVELDLANGARSVQ
jgi:hypothetical protein